MSDVLSEEEINSALKKVPEWEHEGKEIFRILEFDEYMEGIDFVDGVAEIAEDANHHPDIDIRWCAVTVRLTTHDQNGLTDADFELAKRIDTLID